MRHYRQTWAEIDLRAIEHNIKQIRQQIDQETKVIAVVKADGYGHGAVNVAKAALKAGANYLAVALLEEALELREAHIEVPILVFGYVHPKAAQIAAENNITLTVFHQGWLEQVAAKQLMNELHVHLKLDTGMGRVGIRTQGEITRFIEVLKTTKQINLTGVYTHFATADDLALDIFTEQKKTFKQLLAHLQSVWSMNLCIHSSNSAASIREPDKTFNAIRYGIAMYGLYPSLSIRESNMIHLKQAFSLHSELIHVKRIPKGANISYGATYIAQHSEWIGTIPLGYADGWKRSLQGSHVLVDGKRCEIVGRICMDQLMIRLDQYYDIGTKVTLIGVQSGEEITVDEIAEEIQTINYEIPCMITKRVPRLIKR